MTDLLLFEQVLLRDHRALAVWTRLVHEAATGASSSDAARASAVGITVPTLRRTMRQLVQLGLVHARYRRGHGYDRVVIRLTADDPTREYLQQVANGHPMDQDRSGSFDAPSADLDTKKSANSDVDNSVQDVDNSLPADLDTKKPAVFIGTELAKITKYITKPYLSTKFNEQYFERGVGKTLGPEPPAPAAPAVPFCTLTVETIDQIVQAVLDAQQPEAKEPTPKNAAETALVERILQAWVDRMGFDPKKMKLPSRRAILRRRLRDRGMRAQRHFEHFDAILAWASTDRFMRGENDRGVPYDDIVNLFRSAMVFDKYLKVAERHGHRASVAGADNFNDGTPREGRRL